MKAVIYERMQGVTTVAAAANLLLPSIAKKRMYLMFRRLNRLRGVDAPSHMLSDAVVAVSKAHLQCYEDICLT